MKINTISDTIIRQVFLILLIAFIGIIILYKLNYFIPGALGALTLYILFRKTYFRLTEKRGWNKSLASLFLMFLSLLVIGIPLWLLIDFLIPQISAVLSNQQIIIEKFISVKAFLNSKPVLDRINLSEENLLKNLQAITKYIPALLNSVAEVFVNIATAFFILYFMQVDSRNLERKIKFFMPMSEANTQTLWDETNIMVKSNAIGIPILGLCQGTFAAIGYWIFGVSNPVLWGMITGAATVVPAVGTMIIWVPVCIVLFALGKTGAALGLTIYSLIVVGGIDNVLRFTILKKLGGIHPLITVFGVIIGLRLFGVMGLIFGPLLLSYFILLLKIYRTEFGKKQQLLIDEMGTEEIKPSSPHTADEPN
jgi:predicted PurR-regulated permease PerM